MYADRMDALAMSVADTGASRRTLLRRLGLGSLATALGVLGMGGLFGEEAAASKRGCRRRCKKKYPPGRDRSHCLGKC